MGYNENKIRKLSSSSGKNAGVWYQKLHAILVIVLWLRWGSNSPNFLLLSVNFITSLNHSLFEIIDVTERIIHDFAVALGLTLTDHTVQVCFNGPFDVPFQFSECLTNLGLAHF
jgi:hypothetical protein